MVGSKQTPSKTSEETQAEKVVKKFEQNDAANKNDPQAKFYVYLWDPRSSTSKMEKFVTIGSIKNVKEASLGDIRKKLTSEKALSWRQKSSCFCNAVGAEVDDTLSFAMYLDFLNSTETEGEEPSTEGDENSKKSKGQQPVTNEDSNGKSYKVYLKLRKIATELDQETRDFLKEKLEIDLKRPETLQAGSKILSSSYAHDRFMAIAGSGKDTHPADMGEREWYIVLQNNSILHGNYVRELSSGQRKVERAMYPALTLKPRQFHDFEASLDSGINKGKNGKDNKNTTSSNPDNNDDSDNVMHYLRIPRFMVQDDSYVSVSENKSSVANAIADSSLSEHAAEASVGGGAFGVTAGVKVGYKYESSTKTASKTQTDKQRMTITYNFPRVVLELDGESLELSDECKKDLAVIKTKEHVRFFKRKYGSFFATRVELGGRLHSSEESEAFSEGKVGEKAKSLKIAAAASFSSAFAQGSASGSYGDASNNATNKQNSSLNNSLTWEAKGGDTLLCNNPPAWCSTVASYYNWRVVKQEDLLSIEDMISLIPGNEGTRQLFQSLDPPEKDSVGNEFTPKPLPNIWDGWVTFWLKAANEWTYPTVVKPSLIDMINYGQTATPNQNKGLREIQAVRALYPSVRMAESKDDESQIFQGGCKHYEIRDGNTVKYRFRAGANNVLWSNHSKSYLGATSPCEGVESKSYVWAGADWGHSCYFQFIHAFPSDKLHIDHNDLVRVIISDSTGKPIGYLRDMPPMGSYGQSGDIFQFRYKIP